MQKRYDLAVKEFLAATAASPSDPRPPAFVAFALVTLGRSAEAEQAARDAISRAPEFFLGYLALGYARFALGAITEAEDAGKEALRLDPHDGDIHILVARLAEARKDWETMEAHADRALSADPFDTRAAVLKAGALTRCGKVDEAIVVLTRTLGHSPESATVHEELGWSLLVAGRGGEARLHLREALRLDPNSERARAGTVEAMKVSNRAYAATLRMLLWLGRRRLVSPVLGFGLCIAWFVLFAIIFPSWERSAVTALTGYGVFFSFLIFQGLCVSLFDVVLLVRTDGRRLLTTRQRSAALSVMICLAAATIMALVAFLASPLLLIPTVPMATILPYVFGASLRSPDGPYRSIGLYRLLPLLVATEGAVFMGIVAELFGLGDMLPSLGYVLAGLGCVALMFVGLAWYTAKGTVYDPFEIMTHR